MAQGGIANNFQNRFVQYATDKLLNVNNVAVAELKPNKKRDKEIYTFAGSDDSITGQISLFLALLERDRTLRTDIYKEELEDLVQQLINIDAYGRGYIGIAEGQTGNPNRIIKPKLYPVLSEEIALEKGYNYWIFYPDRDEDEWITVWGQPLEIIYQILNYLRERKQLDDVYRLSGYPVSVEVNNNVRFIPYLKFTLTTRKQKPFRYQPGDPVPYMVKTIKLPWPNLGMLTFENIKKVFGGEQGFGWGDRKVSAWVADDISHFPNNKNGMPQVWCGGASNQEAWDNLKAVLSLSDAKIVRVNDSGQNTDKGLDSQDPELVRTPYKVYPYKMAVINASYLNMSSLEGRRKMKAKFETKYNDFPLHQNHEPQNFKDRLEDLLKIR